MENTKCPHIVDNSKSRTTIPHYYCRKTGKVAVTILYQTLYCEECPYSKKTKMPIKPENKSRYKKKWKQTRKGNSAAKQ